MKTRTLFLVAFLFSVHLMAQPCVYEIKNRDEFMGIVELSTQPQTVWSDEHEALVFVLSNDNGKKALEIVHMQRESQMMCFDEGSRMEIIMENGDKVSLENISGPECADGRYSDIHQTMEHFLGAGFRIEGHEEQVLREEKIREIQIFFEVPGHDSYVLPEKVVLHEKGFDLYGVQDFPAHEYFIRTLPCLD